MNGASVGSRRLTPAKPQAVRAAPAAVSAAPVSSVRRPRGEATRLLFGADIRRDSGSGD